MTTFKDFFYKAVLNQEKVKNASPSPLYPGSLIGKPTKDVKQKDVLDVERLFHLKMIRSAVMY